MYLFKEQEEHYVHCAIWKGHYDLALGSGSGKDPV